MYLLINLNILFLFLLIILLNYSFLFLFFLRFTNSNIPPSPLPFHFSSLLSSFFTYSIVSFSFPLRNFLVTPTTYTSCLVKKFELFCCRYMVLMHHKEVHICSNWNMSLVYACFTSCSIILNITTSGGVCNYYIEKEYP